MKIEKHGQIYCPNNDNDWMIDTFMTPHARVIRDGVIRIWGGIRDKDGISRITHIDVDADDPFKVLNVSKTPDLDIGIDGTFDDNGVIMGDVVEADDKLYMYYVGFQHVQKAKFYAFSGMAISDDNGDTFKRYSSAPVMDRTDFGKFGRCIHTVLHEDGIFKCYYAIIHDWHYFNGTPYPAYNIWYAESEDGIHFPTEDNHLCVDCNEQEYRIGRPKVYHLDDGSYIMLYTRDFITKDYVIGMARSNDGINWTRTDDEFVLPKSESGWDSEMTCYPVLLPYKDKMYVFYGGNGMGKTGVGFGTVEL